MDMLFRKTFGRMAAKAAGILRPVVNRIRGIGGKALPKFGNDPKFLTIELPRTICNARHIVLGDHIWLGPGSLLLALTRYPGIIMRHPDRDQVLQSFTPRISIGNRVTATSGLQIAAMCEIVIEDDVMFASNINITDGLHGYENADEPYRYQKMFRIAPIRIKQGCWIGQNVVIMPGVTIGEMSIVGANSVVTRSIPDRCIAVGSPARVIKRWDEEAREWVPEPMGGHSPEPSGAAWREGNGKGRPI